ncbi:PEP-CTERM sorting domain-containing protein [Thalassotalea sp. ND16A]|uniref:PEP-CTERM sorting domain-containing protein n=1 Tax=Thalassotalea sp. ND16A TaxID=1535422 RepID=UPI00051A4CDF|nr:PEP-CTERM sorting domain-containing protein [Thalassotalea sp. ND16A]KGJ88573.1 hypothetical protein ND16A_2503 [Thalassotalea sp. ND16A]
MTIWKLITISFITFTLIATANAAPITPSWESNYGVLSDLSDDDDNNELFDLGFDFTFYGTDYDEVYGSTNGSLFFDDEEDYGIGSDIEDSYGPMIAAFSADLCPECDSDSEIYTNTLGTAGDMRFIMTWLNVIDYEEELYNSFQAILFESGSIQVNYLELNGSGQDNGDDVIGVSSGNGTNFNYFIADDGNDNGIYPNGQSFLYNWNAGSANYDLAVENLSTSTVSVPEPSTLAIFVLGFMGLVLRRFKN